MNKSTARQHYKNLRKQLTEIEIDDKSMAIANRLLSLNCWDKTCYHVFLSVTTLFEVETEFVLHILAGLDKDIIISKSDFTTTKMTHFLLTENTKIKKNAFNIPEPIDGIEVMPKKIDVVFVPLLAFDKTGNRVGYGKGFYDVFLAECNPEVIKIGLSFFEAEEIITDVFENDVKLNYCVTPNTVYSF